MNNNLAYLSYGIPLIFIILSIIYMLKCNKLIGSGKIPSIVSAKGKQELFLFLAVLSAMIILFINL